MRLGGPKEAQSDTAPNYLKQREYQQELPQDSTQTITPEMDAKIAKEFFGRAKALQHKFGISPEESFDQVNKDPEYNAIYNQILRGER